jgi:chromosome segregation ATPase
MKDKSIISQSQFKGISERFQFFIDSMVTEIVIKGEPFDLQKKYLKKYSEIEGLEYEKLESDITTFLEILESFKTSYGKLQVKLAEEKGRECHLTDETIQKLVQHASQTGSDSALLEEKVKDLTINVSALRDMNDKLEKELADAKKKLNGNVGHQIGDGKKSKQNRIFQLLAIVFFLTTLWGFISRYYQRNDVPALEPPTFPVDIPAIEQMSNSADTSITEQLQAMTLSRDELQQEVDAKTRRINALESELSQKNDQIARLRRQVGNLIDDQLE